MARKSVAEVKELVFGQIKDIDNAQEVREYLEELVENKTISKRSSTQLLKQWEESHEDAMRETQTTFGTIRRYSTEELENIITNMFYEEVATSTLMHFMDKFVDQKVIRPRYRYNQRQQRIKDIKFRIDDHTKRRAEETTQEGKQVFSDSIELLTKHLNLEENFNIPTQKEYYKEFKDVYATRTFTEFPLNKKLNALYDDFNAVVLFYDNLTTDEIITKLENAETLEEKKQIVKDNVEITHILMCLVDSTRVSIAVKGALDENYSDVTNDSATTLPIKFSDFGKIRLVDCENIKNNDLAQVMQERIDMDREQLDIIAELTIKGEDYKILKSPTVDKEYIRYVCPSTQRVYYNVLNHDYLKESQYYKKGNAESYIKSWYSIANLFIELTDEEIAKPSISC